MSARRKADEEKPRDLIRDDPRRATYAIPLGEWDGPIVAAIKALGKGTARPDQQIAAIQYIIETMSGAYNLSFRPDILGGSRETDFSEGRRYVGLQLRRVITLPFEILTGKATSGERAE